MSGSRKFRPPLAGYLAIKYTTQTDHDVNVVPLRYELPPAKYVTKLMDKSTMRSVERMSTRLQTILRDLYNQYTNNVNNDDCRLDSIVFFPIDHWVLRHARNRLNRRKLWVDPMEKLEEYVLCQWDDHEFSIDESVFDYFHDSDDTSDRESIDEDSDTESENENDNDDGDQNNDGLDSDQE